MSDVTGKFSLENLILTKDWMERASVYYSVCIRYLHHTYGRTVFYVLSSVSTEEYVRTSV